MNTAALCRTIRAQHSLTQVQLAAALGVSRISVLRWEAGQQVPGATTDAYLRLLLARPETLTALLSKG